MWIDIIISPYNLLFPSFEENAMYRKTYEICFLHDLKVFKGLETIHLPAPIMLVAIVASHTVIEEIGFPKLMDDCYMVV